MAQHEETTTWRRDQGSTTGAVPVPALRRSGRPARVAAAAAAVLAAGALMAGCGDKDSSASPPQKAEGGAAPAGSSQSDHSGHSDHGSGSGSEHGDKGAKGGTGGAGDGGTGGNGQEGAGNTGGSGDSGSASAGGAKGEATSVKGGSSSQAGQAGGQYGSGKPGACTSSDLKGTIGPNHPGAGQENFALVFTNDSGSTCSVRGFPGFAFLNSDGDQVSVNPERNGGSARTVTLPPGKSAWAPLSFSNPQMTGVPTVTPDTALLTPPDQRASIRVDWNGGPVTATGKASVPKIGTLSPGTGGA
ncbi:DUF4232 domain-containing protein [Streptomyces iconiensis]|uniref:DUF4232 domain-containing protein n=1 Tax=Streptomyces iconiensis TaxID=1384038 RepID=A0ABT7A5N0_9ACTN|nr:DUF4232 domain-containing protein [Streptomyces iconiensis]MDJ1136630.1 DUF4232 domain-containing protein [Streptomyces iconiensis]